MEPDSDNAQLAQGLGIKRTMQIQLVQNVSGAAGVAVMVHCYVKICQFFMT